MRLPEQRDDDPEWSLLREHDVAELWDHQILPHVASAYAVRLDLLTDVISKSAPPNGRVLDVGCAQGTLGLRLAERGLKVTLLDVRATHIAYAQARRERGDVAFHVGFLNSECPPDADYDVVSCTEVIEHVPRPSPFLEQLRDKARPGGTVILTTPNADYFASRLPTFGSASQRVIDNAEPNSADGDAHRFFYTREELVALVRGVGLRVEAHGFFSPFWLEGHLKTRLAHRALYRLRNKIIAPPKRITQGRGRIARTTCASQWIAARRAD